jgi:hypothetical protein
MTDVVTAPQKAILQSRPQASRFYLWIDAPDVVLQCQVNQVISSRDKIAQIAFDTVSAGSYSNVLVDQTLLVGSAPGLDDYGQCRIRKAPTSSLLYVSEQSDVNWQDNAYLTVLNEFGIWPRHLRIKKDRTVLMDYDITYSDQHAQMNPVVNLGGPAVAWLTGASVTVQFDASGSWVLGSSISSYAFSSSAGTWTNPNTATPTLTITSAGRVRVKCVVTAANGKASTAYAFVRVFSASDMPLADFTLDSANGSLDGGGWSFSVTLKTSQAAGLRDRARVVLFARDWYNHTEQSLGYLTHRENILASGWISAESITWQKSAGEVSFSVHGPQFWLGKITGFPVGFKSVAATPNSWVKIKDLTVDKALFSMLYWRSTFCVNNDFFKSGDTRNASALEAPVGSLWTQITALSDASILAKPACDRYGRLHVFIDPQYIPEASRTSIPTIYTLDSADTLNGIQSERLQVNNASRVELSGVAVANRQGRALFSLANGHIYQRYGDPISRDRLLLSTQANANILAGLILQKENIGYGFNFTIPHNFRMFDVAPGQYLSISIPAADSPTGQAYSGRVLPREITYRINGGQLMVEVFAEPEIFETLAVKGDIPANDDTGDSYEPPAVPPPAPPPSPPPVVDPGPVIPNLVFAYIPGYGVYFTDTFGASSRWYSMNYGIDVAVDWVNARGMQVSPSGEIYVWTSQDVWRASAPGSVFERILEFSELTLVYGSYCTIRAFSINPVNPYQLVLCAGKYVSGYGSNVWVGSNTGNFQIQAGITSFISANGAISYGQNGWTTAFGAGVSTEPEINRLDASLSSATNKGRYGTGTQIIGLARAGLADLLYAYDEFNLYKITANGDTKVSLGKTTAKGSVYQGLACDPSGQVIFVRERLGTAHLLKSLDGGSNWTDMGAASIHWMALNCGDTQKWIWADSAGIYYSDNQLASSVNATGDLADYVGATISPLMLGKL